MGRLCEKIKKFFKWLDLTIAVVIVGLVFPLLVVALLCWLNQKLRSVDIFACFVIAGIFGFIFLNVLWRWIIIKKYINYFLLGISFFVEGIHVQHLSHSGKPFSWGLAFLCFLASMVCLGNELNHKTEENTNSEVEQFKNENLTSKNGSGKAIKTILFFMILAVGILVGLFVDKFDAATASDSAKHSESH